MLHFQDVSKIYTKPDGEKFYALKNFTYSFDKKGLYCILGKSGSGKSTLANLGALLDLPSEGKITYNGKQISKFKNKEINFYRSKIVTTVFQHYNLLPDLTVIENIIVPRLALQEDSKIAAKDGYLLLKELGFDENFANKRCADLSGGEAQRVAIVRALINSPEVIIADEPTGALDEENSVLIMELLRKIAAKKTVIVITHNTKLALKYSDELIYLKDGQLDKVDIRRTRKSEPAIKIDPPKRLGRHSKWMYQYAFKRLKKNKGKNILSCISTVVGLMSIFMILGFSYGSKAVINSKTIERFDYGVGKISKTETVDLQDSILDLTKMTRLSNNEINDIRLQYPYVDYDVNFDALFSNNTVKINGKEASGITLSFIKKYDDEYCDKSLIIKGGLPKNGGILINENAEVLLKKQLGYPTLLGRDINISSFYNLETTLNKKVINDDFRFNKTFKVAGVCKEFSFLSVPKIYLSYSFIKEILLMDIMPNLSKENMQEITWLDYIKNCNDTDDITSFSHKVFVKRKDINKLEALKEKLSSEKSIDIDCEGMLLKETFISLMDSVEIGLTVFCVLAMIGTVLIIGINAFSSYSFERKNSAIYFAFGVSKSQVFNIFIIESVVVTVLAFMVSVIASVGLQWLVNYIIFSKFNIANLIAIPFTNFYNTPFLLLVCALVFSLMVCIIFTYFPLAISKKINLKKELSDE